MTLHNPYDHVLLAANEDAASPVVFNKPLIRQLLRIHSQYLSNFQGHFFPFSRILQSLVFQATLGPMLQSFWDHFRQVWRKLCVELGSVWDQLGVTFKLVWDQCCLCLKAL